MNKTMLINMRLTPASVSSRPRRRELICYTYLILLFTCVIQARPTGHHRRHEICYDTLEIVTTPEGFEIAIPVQRIQTDTMPSSCPHVEATTPLFDAPISTDPPLGMFPQRDHPLPKPASLSGIPANTPMSTNKFYSNLFLGSEERGVWVLPYMLWLSKTAGSSPYWGLSVSNAAIDKRATGPDPSAVPIQYYISAQGIRSVTFGAREFNFNTSRTTLTNATSQSIELNLHANIAQFGNATKKITFPLVQGMGFVTAQYYDLVPVISSGVIYRKIEALTAPRGGLQKWRLTLEDNSIWLLYACPAAGTPWLTLTQEANTALVGSGSFTGFIQVAKLGKDAAENGSLESVIDSTAGAFPTAMKLGGNMTGATGTYTYNYTRWGQNNANALLIYALQHHLTSFAPVTAAARTGLKLYSTTKGIMEAIRADQWVMVEPSAPVDLGFLPAGISGISASAKSTIRAALTPELAQDMVPQTNLNSMYFSGKGFGKFAQLILVASEVLGDVDVARSGLARLKTAIAPFLNNGQIYPLAYDRTWKGLVSSAMYVTGQSMEDFGNGYYNDHHFHWGYFVYTAAIIARQDRILNNSTAWVNTYKPFINQLLRDVANPSDADPYFPVSRAFDWYHGHSWAKGLFESGDGKDQESTSEDMHFAYGMKLWGKETGNAPMEARADLMLAIMKRTFNLYFLLEEGNTTHPWNFTPNKVTGILFENKVDHTTYFSARPECIQGIHMIPLTPASPYYRSAKFTEEEWNTYFSNRTGNINDGWKGILYANVAMFQPKSSWLFFAQSGFNNAWLDGGASRAWYLTLAAGLGGAQ